MNRAAYGITPENLLRTLPEVLKNDKAYFAIASVMANIFADIADKTNLIKIYTRIDELPEDLLDILAYDFRVDWWDPNYSLDEKRQIMKDSFHVHRRVGTKAAVVRAISVIYKDTDIEEWFEYDGDPYHFRLLIDATYDGADPVKHQRVLDRLDYYKNLRSAPYTVEYTAHPQGSCTTYAAVAAFGMEIEITAEVKVYGLG